jgi:oligopeptide transport system substrate-binding protein
VRSPAARAWTIRAGGVLALAALGCSADRAEPYFGDVAHGPEDPAALTINCGTEPEHVDPGLVTDNVGQELVQALFEGLTTPDPRDMHPVQGVAARWDRSADGRLYRFHLRPEARWSDGRPVTARDFVYAWRRVVRPETGSGAVANLFPVKNAEAINLGRLDAARLGVRAIDDLTLDVELERPTPYFLDLTSRPALLPVREDVIEAFAQRGEAERWTRPEGLVSNGPFIVASWVFHDAITMIPNPHYWAPGAIRLRRLTWLEIDETRTAMNLFKAGELDAFGSGASIPAEYRAALAGKKDLRRFPLLMTYWYDVNTRARPLDDARVRRALDLAVDKRALVERVMGGGEIAATHYVPETIGGGYAERAAADRAAGIDPLGGEAYAPDRARALMREAGHAIEGDPPRAAGLSPVEILYNTDDDGHRRIAVAIQDMWRRELGVTATLRVEDWKVMLDDVRAGRFQIACGSWIADYDHPQTFLETFASGSLQNWTGWADPRFDDALARAARTVDPAASLDLYRQAEAIAVAGRSRLPIFFATGSTLVKPWVKGFYGTGQAVDLARWMWIDPAWRSHPENEPASAPIELPPPGLIDAP